jgi:hypothetical protein
VLLVIIKKKNDHWNSGPDSEELSILSQTKSTMHKIEAWLGCVILSSVNTNKYQVIYSFKYLNVLCKYI